MIYMAKKRGQPHVDVSAVERKKEKGIIRFASHPMASMSASKVSISL
jgi:hypothetical protein